MTDPAIDATAWIGPYPFRDLPGSGVGDLLRLCDREGIELAIASPFASLFAENNLDAFARFARAAGHKDRCEFWPVVNPSMPRQAHKLRALHGEFGFRGIRLLPMFHDYSLCDPCAEPIASMAAELGLVMQVFHGICDERWHWMHHVPPLPIHQIEYAAARFPQVSIMVCGLPHLESIATVLLASDHITADLSLVRGPEGAVESLCERLLANKLVFGSQWPVQTLESTLWQVRHATIGPQDRRAILGGNLRRLLARGPSAAAN